jgi:hypothetical protein
MKKALFILYIVMLIFVSLLHSENFKILKPQTQAKNLKRESRPDEIIYEETFETDDNGWTHYDGTMPSSMWHLDDVQPHGDTGYSWWMGDPTIGDIGGYIDHLYVVLDTPLITVPEGGHLTFNLAYYVEDPAGTMDPWDGWDGCNVRISRDGIAWTPISGSPAYNCESLYSFGFEHGEGPGVPGWCGESEGWLDADFDLSVYAGQTVQIRFAFASDPAYCTQNQHDMFGMMVDNISLGEYSYDFDDNDEHGMTYTSVVPVGGDIWHRAEVADAPSQSYAMICQNDAGSYNTGMTNYLESPTITLPITGEIKADFMIKGSFDDEDNFPEVDYFGWEASPDNGETWYYMSNPCADPDGNNFVFSDVPNVWSSMIETYSLSGRLDGLGVYEGADAKFRIYFQTDNDDPDGIGIMIDDFKITSWVTGPCWHPENLQAVYNAPNVDLTWDPIEFGGGSGGWLNWDSGENIDGIGTDSSTILDAAARFPANDLIAYEGGIVTTIKFFPREEACDYTVKVWDTEGENILYSQYVPNTIIGEWNDITLETPLVLASGTEYWFGYTANTEGGYPLGHDEGPMVDTRGGYIRQNNGDWAQLTDFGLDYNWNIQAYVFRDGTESIATGNTRNREITDYNVYRSSFSGGPYELIGNTEATDEPYFTDSSPLYGAVNYYVATGIWDGLEGAYSNEAEVYVLADTETELFHDDGTAESGFNVGSANSMAVQFTTELDGREFGTLTHLRLFVESWNTGQIIVKVWNDNVGIPGEQIAQFVHSAMFLREGWNTIEFPNPPTIDSAYNFYIGFFEMAGLAAIGFDEDGFGHSFTYENGGEWEANTEGNIMIRAIFDTNVASGEEEVSPTKYVLSNYPNPFNPSTTISLNITDELAENAELTIYNLKGQKIRSYSHPELIEGAVVWNGDDELGNQVSSGIYFYKLKTTGHSKTKKMIMIK